MSGQAPEPGEAGRQRPVTGATPSPGSDPPPLAARQRRRIRLRGAVQAVGLRRAVADLARRLALSGFVANDEGGIVLEIEGPATSVERFVPTLRAETPPLVRLRTVDIHGLEPAGGGTGSGMPGDLATGFWILSRPGGPPVEAVEPPPDLAICDACLTEVRDRRHRRTRYAFTSCAHCGPGYTILEALPLVRRQTVMRQFPPCEACRREVEAPGSGRHHSTESIACPQCGPRLVARQANGRSIDGDPTELAAATLAGGGIVALKGLGGFQLLVDASNEAAVAQLRERKRCPATPFAVMVRDVQAARELVELSGDEEALLDSPERPIVLLARRPGIAHPIADGVALHERCLGIMLPTTALHAVLLDDFTARTRCGVLVVTSGNCSGEPLEIDGEGARRRLAGVASLFLDHDREILRGADDSIVRIDADGPTFVRRGRGYVPQPLALGDETPALLACGADQDSVICLVRGGSAFMSPHLGALTHPETAEVWRTASRDLMRLLGGAVEGVAVDGERGSVSARLGRELAAELQVEVVEVQHHHAHIASCLAEHGEHQTVIGIVLDGSGEGTDGADWGGEVLVADRRSCQRAGHLGHVPMVGGRRAAEEPWRMAVSHLYAVYGDLLVRQPLELFEHIDPDLVRDAITEIKDGGARPLTSSAGRLFDAVSALLGLCYQNRFEAEAAMSLECALGDLGGPGDETYGVRIQPHGETLVLCTEPLVRGVVIDLVRGLEKNVISLRFHRSLAALLAAACECVWKRSGIYTVALSGSVFRYRYLTAELTRRLKRLGFRVLRQQVVPSGDGGLALGQAAVVAARVAKQPAAGQPIGA